MIWSLIMIGSVSTEHVLDFPDHYRSNIEDQFDLGQWLVWTNISAKIDPRSSINVVMAKLTNLEVCEFGSSEIPKKIRIDPGL